MHVENAPQQMLDLVSANAGVDDSKVFRHVIETFAAPVVGKGIAEKDDRRGRSLFVILFNLNVASVVFPERIGGNRRRRVFLLRDSFD
jgi:hypothetical protein